MNVNCQGDAASVTYEIITDNRTKEPMRNDCEGGGRGRGVFVFCVCDFKRVIASRDIRVSL